VTDESPLTAPSQGSRIVTGPRVVAAMFTMGIVATGLLYAYWTLHLMPFMPLQEAIVAEFPGSAPRVDGGQQRMHRVSPKLLRIQMKCSFNPLAEDAETATAREHLLQRISDLVREKVEFPGLDLIELHLYKLVQEKEIVGRSFQKKPSEETWTPLATDSLPIGHNGNPVAGDATEAAPFPDEG
jgi:hypothetical protein